MGAPWRGVRGLVFVELFAQLWDFPVLFCRFASRLRAWRLPRSSNGLLIAGTSGSTPVAGLAARWSMIASVKIIPYPIGNYFRTGSRNRIDAIGTMMFGAPQANLPTERTPTHGHGAIRPRRAFPQIPRTTMSLR